MRRVHQWILMNDCGKSQFEKFDNGGWVITTVCIVEKINWGKLFI